MITEGLLETHNLLAGTTVTLPCRVTGVPTPSVKWYKDGVSFHNPGVGGLVLHNVTLRDNGRYKCVAVNVDGEAISVGTVDVQCKKVVETLHMICTRRIFAYMRGFQSSGHRREGFI